MRVKAWDADATTMRAWDGVTGFWVMLWLVIGTWTGYQIWQLTGLSTSTVQAGKALGTAGKALQDLSGIPLIGSRTGELGNEVATTGTGIVAGGQRAESSIRALAVLVGLAVGLSPAGPVLLLYLPRRLARGREIRGVSRVLQEHGASPVVLAHLANRAVSSLTMAELMKVTPDPAADLAAGRHESLAAAELSHLGLALPPARA